MCRSVVVANLERYPPKAFQVCGEEDFDSLVRQRHAATKPKTKGGGSRAAATVSGGGLDGTGRVAPAISDKFLAEVELRNPQLRESKVVDELVWKDCVEFRFRRGGVARPPALTLPWPLLVAQIADACGTLADSNTDVDGPEADRAYEVLRKSPMNVSLLQSTGAGKVIKKALKLQKRKCDTPSAVAKYERLERLLESWKELAAQSGVQGAAAPSPKKKLKTSPPSADADATSSKAAGDQEEVERDLRVAETCLSWRQLFAALKRREEMRRESQGKRMREIRKNLACDRPKVVKVRPTPAKHSRILAHPEERKRIFASSSSSSSAAAAGGGGKMLQLRKETSAVAAFQRSNHSQAVSSSRKSSSFGAAVAFAACSKTKRAPAGGGGRMSKPSQVRRLAGGKQMKVPTRTVQGSGGAPRQFASKWKVAPPPPRPPRSGSGGRR